MACGRRFGKTSLSLIACVRGHGPRRGFFKGAVDGAKIGWFAPTYGTFAEIWRYLKQSTQNAWVDKSETERRIVLPGGGSIRCGSLDNPDSPRGEGYDGIVIDEAAYCKRRAWTEVLRPALADRQGWAMFPSTPNGRNWFCTDLFEPAANRLGWERWQLPTVLNPLVPPEELADAQLDMGARAYAQEHEAQFMDVAGAEWDGSYFSEDKWFDEWPDDIVLKVLALDPSKGKTDRADYSAFVFLGLDPRGTMWIDADLARRDLSQITDYGLRLVADWEPHSFAVEATQFQELLCTQFHERSKDLGFSVPVTPIHSRLDKTVRIRATLTAYLSRGEFRFRRTRGCRMLVDQLQTFPEGQYDDGPDALEMAVTQCKRLFFRPA